MADDTEHPLERQAEVAGGPDDGTPGEQARTDVRKTLSASRETPRVTKTIKIDATKRGLPAMWEQGGGLTSGGSAIIIAKRDGQPPRPVYMPRGGHLAGGKHALIPVHEGYFIVRTNIHHGSRDSATVERILSTSANDVDGERWDATAAVEVVNTFSRGEWDRPLDPKLADAVEAAFHKADDYHCRSTYFVDTSEKRPESADAKQRREAEMRRQDETRARLRQEKIDREARAKAEAEAASKAAKEAGLGTRLEALNVRLTALERETVELGEVSFRFGWQGQQLYTEQNVASVERHVAQLEAEKAEKERQRLARETFQPKFEAFQPRIDALGLIVEFSDDRVRFSGDYHDYAYSDDGVATFAANLDYREREAATAKAKAEAEAIYQQRKTEAVELGLPADIRIWCRRGGRTNAGDGWVIGPDGQDRGNTAWHNPRARWTDEGDKIWEQILKGEVVLKWTKRYSAAPHEFEVVHLPAEGLTEAQKERILEIQEQLEREWEGARGLASGEPSPAVGDGWGLCEKRETAPSGPPATLEDLRKKWGAR